jgi:hypothetical protein
MARIVVILSSGIAALGTVGSILGAISPTFAAVPQVGKWLALAGVAVAAAVQAGYGLQRTLIKLAAINAGQVALVLLLAVGLGGCAGMKGDTVTASAGPHGGCVSSDAYVRLGSSQVECLSACVSDQTGVQVTCRPISQPAVARTLVLPATTPATP